ncbi:MAG: MoxR family ATPase [Muribaculaceae bacterium]|nr:MoxR family ATPase [Muribaculaceae bacterium]
MYTEKISQLKNAVGQIIVGQNAATNMLLTAIIADGHVLLEGVPGVAKTLLARLMARLLGAQYGRIQFTPDLMPSDVLGTEVYDPNTASFRFHQGPVFGEIILADEINRAPAKTQAALFEVMEERQVTVAGKTYKMSPVFTILATQNPIEQEGTYRLPEAQLDRFLCKIVMGYPSVDEEVVILSRHQLNTRLQALDDVAALLSPSDILEMRAAMDRVLVDTAIMRYIANITAITRNSPTIVMPASPRAAVCMMRMAKAFALISGRDYVSPDDVRMVAPAVLVHRIQLSTEAEMEGINIASEISRLLNTASAELK